MARSKIWMGLAAAVLLLALGVVAGRMSAPPHGPKATSASGERKVLYYRNPMGLPDTSPVPKKDPMGMDYIAVHEGEEDAGTSARGGIALSPERIQTLGVRTEPAVLGPWDRRIRAVGRFEAAEPGLSTVTTKFEGWIERLHVNAVGRQVRAGEPLMAIYSPELVSTQREYLVALEARRSLARASPQASAGADALLRAARERLRNWDISAAAIARLERTGEVQRALVLHAPSSGVVTQRMATVGMRVMPGERLFEIADLSQLWLMIDVFEQDLGAVTQGAEALIEVAAEPGRLRSGRVEFVYPTMDEATRTTRIRVAIENADGALRPGMYATAQLRDGDPQPHLSVPDLALLDTGTRQLLIVALGEGRFEPREVRAGRRADGRVEILAGLAPGDRVVTRANFLIDAESNLRAAAASLSPHAGHGDDVSATAPVTRDQSPGNAAAAPNGHGSQGGHETPGSDADHDAAPMSESGIPSHDVHADHGEH